MIVFIIASQCVEKQTKKRTRDDKKRNAVITFGKCSREQIKVKRDSEKPRPTKLSNSSNQK